jgi:diguanylate cyclase (GGDEF)-like protein
MLALSVIAGLAIGSYLILDHALEKNAGSAFYVNFAGRQRMLSERIASLAAQYHDGDEAARVPLEAAADELAANDEVQTRHCIAAHHDDEISAKLYQLYTEQPDGIDAQVMRYVANVRLLEAIPDWAPGAAAAKAAVVTRIFAAARAPLLNVLDEAVTLQQVESQRLVESGRMIDFRLLWLLLLALAAEALLIFRPMVRTINQSMADVVRLATVDPLSGLINRRGFIERFDIEQARARRYERPLTLLMIDADHFKLINDTYGHEAGDEVLKLLSNTIKSIIRITDIPARMGGEEFSVLMTETDLAGAVVLAERLREAVAAQRLLYEGHLIAFTVSIGVVQVPAEASVIGPALHCADQLLYQAKARGRDCVVSPS